MWCGVRVASWSRAACAVAAGACAWAAGLACAGRRASGVPGSWLRLGGRASAGRCVVFLCDLRLTGSDAKQILPVIRKGRFSQSVELKSLHQAAQTVVAKYTYLLSPYSTFENTGKRRWPMSYNPKTLIAKSIRNLATGRIEQKLTVRRV